MDLRNAAAGVSNPAWPIATTLLRDSASSEANSRSSRVETGKIGLSSIVSLG